MIKILLSPLIFLILFCSSEQSLTNAHYAEVNVLDSSFLFVRAEPHFNATEIDRLKNKQRVIILLEDDKILEKNGVSGKYVFIEYRKDDHLLKGWVFDSYLIRITNSVEDEQIFDSVIILFSVIFISLIVIAFWKRQAVLIFLKEFYNKLIQKRLVLSRIQAKMLFKIIRVFIILGIITVSLYILSNTLYKNRYFFQVFSLSQNETIAMRYLITIEKIMKNGSIDENSDYYMRMINITDTTDIDIAKAIASSEKFFQHFRNMQIKNDTSDDFLGMVIELFSNPTNFLGKLSENFQKSNELIELESEFISNNKIIISNYSNVVKILNRLTENEIDYLYENKRLPIYLLDERE
ncbi:MAG TPA: SH3 domain-containing protein [Leptospiraceae bacterium]|nr:SH3 domain-containing protein [Leptospiraceae bacterium]HMW05481.1 SH3 domain-containing protein [Leptospiraceae bacterium]HMX33212.1 SH3 domain-containing protein [Leptospiraceae bacterium]HMY30991.1 SH3 domain-containing protein [Leptospiraceae bacterium]HMZ64395.1 SH3 domain-containing protein [Leptospiraceae bacterium]